MATAAIPRLAALESEAARREAAAAVVVLSGILDLHRVAPEAVLSAAAAPVMRAAPAPPGKSALLMSLHGSDFHNRRQFYLDGASGCQSD